MFAMKTKYILPAALCLISCAHKPEGSPATGAAEARASKSKFDPEFVVSCAKNPDCEIEIFKRLAQIYRPSKEEKQVREELAVLAQLAKDKIWNGNSEITFEEDKGGNFLIRVPATGKFVKDKHSAVAVQAHMDMVLAVKDLKPDEDRKIHFKNGVDIVITEGWMHTRDFKTTMGADDGIGMAVALRYLLDPGMEHPPLELVFTADEEAGMSGVRDMNLPLKARELINIDSPDYEGGRVTLGSMGGKVSGFTADIQLKKLPPNMKAVSVYLSGLKGGHSGVDIKYERLNAIKAFASVFSEVLRKHPSTWLLQMNAGGVTNQIPTSYLAVVAVPESEDISAIQAEIEKATEKLASKFHDEERKPRLNIEPAEISQTHGLSPDRLAIVLDALRKTPHGILQKKKIYPDSIQTSSNLAKFMFEPFGSKAKMEFTTYTRSFLAPELMKMFEKINGIFAKTLESGETPVYVSATRILPPWVANPKSKLLKRAFAKSQYFHKTAMCPCGLEPGFIFEKFPDMEIISVGVNLLNPHTVNEKFEIESARRLSKAIARLLASAE